MVPAAGDGTLAHLLYVSLVSSQMETVSKTFLFKIGQYCLALLHSPRKSLQTSVWRPSSYLESYQPIIL